MNSILKIILHFSFFIFHFSLNAQLHEDVFPNLTDEELAQALIDEYTPDSVIDYNFARDTLYLKIDAVERNLSCIYTGLTLFIPEGTDPTQAVFLNGANNGINAEHVFPQAYFVDDSPPVSDMHNLYPSKVKTNNDRANFPFEEVPDNLTDIWYRDASELNSKPTSNIDEYSEFFRNGSDSSFEPREKVKGDIARSMFYIHSIYSTTQYVEPLLNDYFEMQKETLCNWHFADVVDSTEWNRTKKIKFYQGNENPFVLDCSVAQRLYCTNHTADCIEVGTVENNFEKDYFIYDVINSELIFTGNESGLLTIANLNGQIVFTSQIENSTRTISLNKLPFGIYNATYTSKSIRSNKKIQVRR